MRPAADDTARPRKLRPGLMDPDDPRPIPRSTGMTLTTVQMWVASVLAVSTLLHFAGGLVLAAYYSEPLDARIGLLVIGGVTGVLAVFAGLAIHRQRLASPWLLLGLLPALVGAYLMFGR